MNSDTFSISFSGSFLLYFFLYLVVWLFIFIDHLRRQDYESSDRIVWTIILASVPVIGVFLYLLMSGKPLQRDAGPSVDAIAKAAARAKDDAEAEAKIKERCNNQG